MERRALIVTGAAEPEDVVNAALTRFSFAAPDWVPSLGAAVSRLRNEHFDLIIVPIHPDSPVDMSLLEHEIRRERPTHVIGTSNHSDSELILRALRAGVHEFLALPLNMSELSGALDRLSRRMSAKKVAEGKVIAVYSAKGGMGTTTVAVNLAAAIAQRHSTRRLALADLVVLGGDVRVMLNLKPLYDIGDLVMKVDRVDADLLFSLLTQATTGLWALPSSDNAEVLELIDSGAITTILSHLRSHFAYVIVDTEHFLSDRSLTALDTADRIMLVTQLSVTALRSAQRTLQLFERLGYGENKVAVVVNRHNADEALKVGDAESVLGRPIFAKLPNDYKACSEALTRGTPVVTSASASGLGRAYQLLAAKVSGVETNGAVPAEEASDEKRSRLTRLLRIGKKHA
ncbi:MAG TPA: P-loop NTPase [Gemmatimonadaceae bacterium]|nr:P-loop NTPase [Gemmatimonadaceae bacterium]